jgi:hypothetical protein
MMRFISFVSISLSIFALAGCAAMQQDYQNRMCNYDAAFEDGANAARQHGQMEGSMIASNCPIEAHDSVMSGYRAGYASVPIVRPVLQPVTPVIIVQPPESGFQNPTYPGHRPPYGGYSPTAPRGAGVLIPTAPPAPPQQCLEAYGRRVCGYGCKESYGNIRCASDPRHACMDSYGKIYCGMNCREDVGHVVCDEWD